MTLSQLELGCRIRLAPSCVVRLVAKRPNGVDGTLLVFPESDISRRDTLAWADLRTALLSGRATILTKGHKHQ